MGYDAQYYDIRHAAGYAGARNLIDVNLKRGESRRVTKARVEKWLREQDAYTLHRPMRRRFPRLSYNVTNVDDCWEIDLCDMQRLKTFNDGYSYILVVIDVLSKFAWVEPLRDKSSNTVRRALEMILKRAGNRVPILVQSDKGKEFVAFTFTDFLQKQGIVYRTVRNPDVKAAVVERLNRTLKERMYRYFTHKNTHRYIDVLQNIVDAYNHSLHSAIRMIPAEVNMRNAPKARANLLRRAASQRKRSRVHIFNVGDFVRISRSKGVFEKGYTKNFSEEIFKITRVSHRQNLFTYELCDLQGESIDGFFYPEELTLVGVKRATDADEEYKIERIVKSKGKGRNKELFVKWLGYPDKFNSWIKASELLYA